MTERTQTQARRDALYEDRWSSLGDRSGILDLAQRLTPAELARYEIFQGYDEGFLETLSPDVSVCRWQGGAVLFEEGSYIDLAFFVAQGEVDVFLARQAAHLARVPIFDPLRTCLGGAERPQEAPLVSRGTGPLSRTLLSPGGGGAPGPVTFLATMDFDLPRDTAMRLGAGEIFGEIGAMSGWPQSVTARTATATTLVQIRLPALRALRRRSPAFKERLDRIYRQHSLADQLQATPLLQGSDPAFLSAFKEVVELVSLAPGEVVAEQGEAADALYLVRSGFVRQAQRLGEGEISVNYLSKGMTFGEVELLIEDTGGWTATASAVEHAELVRIPLAEARNLLRLRPEVERRLWESAVDRIREAGFARRNTRHSELLNTALERGLVEGNSILVIDLETCTRCDDCVRACAATHGGRPRFVREGDRLGPLQIAHACYHCRDPLCLVGCPTGAIHRTGTGAVVEVTETICIGCGTCARSCPYDAILVEDTGTPWGEDALPASLRGQPRRVASKCDLCHTRESGPACVQNCPNGCAFRVGSLEEIEELLGDRR
ncbi:MAG: cyclic nucleotide-binding domain-containing protein [Acidobacteria bacterium]|nr:cyclic nucleotide-binding domain-containing protein [Acidobacteriota bacterium]